MMAGVGILLLLFSLKADVQQSNAVVITALQGLHEISKSAPPGDDRRAQVANQNSAIEMLIQPLTTRQLAQLALAAYAMTSGLAEHESVDEVFRSAFWSSTRRIADDPSPEAAEALARIAARSGIDDGGDLLMMRELLAKHAKRRAAANAKEQP